MQHDGDALCSLHGRLSYACALPWLAAVQYIVDTVVQALKAEPHRRSIYAEMVNLQREDGASLAA